MIFMESSGTLFVTSRKGSGLPVFPLDPENKGDGYKECDEGHKQVNITHIHNFSPVMYPM